MVVCRWIDAVIWQDVAKEEEKIGRSAPVVAEAGWVLLLSVGREVVVVVFGKRKLGGRLVEV